MALRSSNSSIVDRLLAAKASDKTRPRGGLTSAHDAPFRAQASATMSPDERRALVQRMLQQRKQASFSDSPSSPQIESHRPDEASRDIQNAPVSMAPTRSPPRKPFRPGELISPASSHEGSTRAQPAARSTPGIVPLPHSDASRMREVSESSNAPLQQYAADGGAEPPALQACVSPEINIKGGGRYVDANGSPESLGTSHLQPQPPQHQAPSCRPPTPQRRSREAPPHFLTNPPSPGADQVPDRSYAQSYGPTAAEPLIMEMSSMVLRGEASDASLPNHEPHAAPQSHPHASTDSQQATALRMGAILAPEFSWQSTCPSDSIPGASEAIDQRRSAAQPQLSQSRPESIGRESSAAQSLYFACDLLAEGNSAGASQQHNAESSGSFQHDPLCHGAAALRAAQEQQQQVAPHRASGMAPAMACSTTSARSINSDLIDRAAAVDPFCAPPMPTAEYSAAATDVSANFEASDWNSKATDAWESHEYSPAFDTAQSTSDGHQIRTTQSLPVGVVQDSAQLDTIHASFSSSWETQNASAPDKEPLAPHHRVGRSGHHNRAQDLDLTASVGRGGVAGQAHRRGKTRQEVLEEVMRERAAKGRQPRSQSARAGARPRTAGPRSATAAAGAGSQRIEELARPRSIERYTARQKDAEEDELRECTFAPQITTRRSASARRAPHRRDLSIPAGERLHHAHDHVAKVRTRKQTEAMKEELAACTFTPQLHPPPSNIAKKPYVPLQERAATLVKQKNARLDQTRMNQELFDPQATFSPALNQRSIRLAALAAARKAKRPMHASMPGSSASERHPPTFDRHPSDTHSATTAHTSSEASFNPAWAFPPASQKLTQTVGHNASPRMGSMRASGGPRASRRSRSASPVPWKGAEPSDSKDCTFAPAVNVATDAYLQKAGIPATFEERQAFYEQRRHQQAHVQQAALDPECTFRPQTAHPEAILAASSRRAHLEETQEEFWLRMTSEASRRDCMLRAIDNVQQQQFTFAPSINPRSRRLARSKNVEELATDPQRHAFREAAAAAAEQRLAQECTFVPDTSKPGVPGTSGVEPKAPFTVCGQKSDNIIERIQEYKDGRSRKLEQVRNRREWAELQECTFAPKTNTTKARSRPSSQAPVLVRGLDAHMSKLERAKKMAADEAARRAKIFLEEPKAPRAKFTITKPFNISENQAGRDLKRMQLQEERKAESMRECTFKPETNEGKKRQILEQILAADPF